MIENFIHTHCFVLSCSAVPCTALPCPATKKLQVELTTCPPQIVNTTRSLDHKTKLKFERQYQNLHAKPDTGIESHIATQSKSAPYGHMLKNTVRLILAL